MKNAKVSLLALSVLAGGILAASAAATPKTTYVLNANIALQSWADGATKATKIDDKAVIGALTGGTLQTTITVINTNVVPPTTNIVTTNITLNFTSKAKLLITQQLLSVSNNPTKFIVRDGTGKNTIDFDVSKFFFVTNTPTATVTAANGNSETVRSILGFVFNQDPTSVSGSSNALSFAVSGFSQENRGKVGGVPAGFTSLLPKTINSTVAGGTGTNTTTVITGKISANGGHLE